MTMKQHNGPINPPNVLTGEIYGWQVSESSPYEVIPVVSDQKVLRSLITVEDFVEAGHGLYSINDPSMIQLADGSYRLYVGALVDKNHYSEFPELEECTSIGDRYSWVILSATSSGSIVVSESAGLVDS
jgi:hypothetical protein